MQKINTSMLRALATAAALSLLSGCDSPGPDPGVTFMPYDESHASKPDFADLEHRHPLTAEQRALITPGWLASLEQEQVDQIYARLSAGPIPDGAYDGDLFFPKGASGNVRISEVVGGLKGFAINLKSKKLDLIGEILWKGKVFFREQRVLRNMIQDKKYLELIVDDPDSLEKVVVEGKRSWFFFPMKAWLLFPAKLYCGQSLLDGRRESIIIDYAFSDQIEGYHERPDFLAGRRGFQVRDEIRMVRRGFYLGRAYMGRVFALNFTLYNATVAEAGEAPDEDCWSGTQTMAARGSGG
jgi:hypothetical protein